MRTVVKILTAKAISFCLIAIIALSTLGQNHVLCIGENGHIQIELSSDEGDCRQSDGPEHQHSADDEDHSFCTSHEDVCCARCVDIPIPVVTLESATLRNDRYTASEAHAQTLITSTSCLSHLNSSQHTMRLGLSHTVPLARPPATVVMRI